MKRFSGSAVASGWRKPAVHRLSIRGAGNPVAVATATGGNWPPILVNLEKGAPSSHGNRDFRIADIRAMNQSDPAIEELIRRARDGDREALGALLEQQRG